MSREFEISAARGVKGLSRSLLAETSLRVWNDFTLASSDSSLGGRGEGGEGREGGGRGERGGRGRGEGGGRGERGRGEGGREGENREMRGGKNMQCMYTCTFT